MRTNRQEIRLHSFVEWGSAPRRGQIGLQTRQTPQRTDAKRSARLQPNRARHDQRSHDETCGYQSRIPNRWLSPSS